MGARYIPLFWRLFVPNATVLAVASVILMVQPPNGRVPVLLAGLVVMLGVNLVLMRRAFTPLDRLAALMHRIDPLDPGKRVPPLGAPSEVTVLSEAFNEMLDRLEAERRDSALRALSEREAERRELAGELHDQLGQTLTAIALQLQRVAETTPPPARNQVLEAADSVQRTIEDTRRLARKLRPEALDTLGLVPALTNLAQRLTHQTGVQIIRRLDRELPALTPDAELVLFRMAQESLTNAVRHAEPSHVELMLRAEGSRVQLRVTDDGRGISPDAPAGTGIRAMRERAMLLGGVLSIGPRRDGHGTEVTLELDAERL